MEFEIAIQLGNQLTLGPGYQLLIITAHDHSSVSVVMRFQTVTASMKTLARISFIFLAILSLSAPLRADLYRSIHVRVVTPSEIRVEGELCAIEDLADRVRALRAGDKQLEVRILTPMAQKQKFIKEVSRRCREGGATLIVFVQTS